MKTIETLAGAFIVAGLTAFGLGWWEAAPPAPNQAAESVSPKPAIRRVRTAAVYPRAEKPRPRPRRRSFPPPYGWTKRDKTWRGLGPFQRATAMALMEAEVVNRQPHFESARNALTAMLNRSAKLGEPLGNHVSRKIYEPTWHKKQQRRLKSLLAHPYHSELMAWGKKRARGEVPDPVQGATHFAIHPRQMYRLAGGVHVVGGRLRGRKWPYISWPTWTKFNPKTMKYGGETVRDRSHSFFAPEGKYHITNSNLWTNRTN